MSGKRMILIAGMVVIAVLLMAWFHGGEEPIRPIEYEVRLPESGQ